MSKYVTKISKDEINELPLIKFTGEIFVVHNRNTFQQAIELLRQEYILGFDTESRPSFRKGTCYPVSLLQLATADKAFLFQLHHYPLQPELIDILSSDHYIKAGVAIHDDIKGLQNLKSFTPQGFVELVSLAKQHGITNSGLRALAAIVLKGRISKRAQLSNWAKKKYDQTQLVYAATDAWIGYALYQKLV